MALFRRRCRTTAFKPRTTQNTRTPELKPLTRITLIVANGISEFVIIREIRVKALFAYLVYFAVTIRLRRQTGGGAGFGILIWEQGQNNAAIILTP